MCQHPNLRPYEPTPSIDVVGEREALYKGWHVQAEPGPVVDHGKIQYENFWYCPECYSDGHHVSIVEARS